MDKTVTLTLRRAGTEATLTISLRTFKGMPNALRDIIVRILSQDIRRQRLERVCARRGHRVREEGICDRCMAVVDKGAWAMFKRNAGIPEE